MGAVAGDDRDGVVRAKGEVPVGAVLGLADYRLPDTTLYASMGPCP
jgi:hypothetical protein